MTAAAYASSLANDFTMDDRLVALGVNDAGQPNERIYRLQPLSAYFTTPYWGDTDPNDRLFRPLTVLTFALRHHFFADHPLPAHLANVLLHLVATGLVFLLLRRLRVGESPALLATLVFGLHAIHSEAVVGVVGRAELLAFAGGAGGVLVAAKNRPSTPAALAGGVAGAVLLFLAYCSKESALAWGPFLLAFLLAGRWRDTPEALSLREAALLGGRAAAVALPPALLFLGLRARMLAALPGEPEAVLYLVNPLAHAPVGTRLLSAIMVLGFGLLLTLAPFRLAADYGAVVFRLVTSPLDPRFLVATGVLGGLLAAAVVLRRRQPLLFLAVAAFFLFTFITSNLPFAVGTIFGERLYYAPSLALSLAVAWLAERALDRPRATVALFFGTGLWVGASTLVILQRNPVWKDDATLFHEEVRVQPRSVRMHTTVASVHSDRGEPFVALHHLERAVELDPEYALGWNNMAAILLELGRLDEAEAAVRRGLQARHRSEREDLFKLRCNLGLILVRRGEVSAGSEEIAACLRLRPQFLRAWHELWALVEGGSLTPERLGTWLDEASAEPPQEPVWALYRGLLAHHTGQLAEAEALLAPALGALPHHGEGAEIWAEGRLALADTWLRRARTSEGCEALGDLLGDRFTPVRQRGIAADLRAGHCLERESDARDP